MNETVERGNVRLRSSDRSVHYARADATPTSPPNEVARELLHFHNGTIVMEKL